MVKCFVVMVKLPVTGNCTRLRRPIGAEHFGLLQDGLRGFLLLVGRLAVLAQDSLDENADFGAYGFLRRPSVDSSTVDSAIIHGPRPFSRRRGCEVRRRGVWGGGRREARPKCATSFCWLRPAQGFPDIGVNLNYYRSEEH